jgi:signal transduction histidine kinase
MANSPKEALELLNSDGIGDRFMAVRYFIKNKHPEFKPDLINRRKIERVRHIKMALNQAISGIDLAEQRTPTDNIDFDSSTEEALKRYLKAQAIHEFSGTIIHELSKKIGLLDISLRDDFLGLVGSNTERNFKNLKTVFQGIENLQRSASTPKTSEFDLPQLIRDIVYQEDDTSDVNFNFEGAKPCIIRTDLSILSLALSNGIRNSIEAVRLVPNYTELNNIVICWGKNDHDLWVSIIDNGVGLQGEPEEAFKVGSTNKDGHIGFGLGILDQCMETLGGLSELSNAESGGAKLVLRWNIEQ